MLTGTGLTRGMVKKGKFITFEGIDGSGKSTQIVPVVDFLRERGRNVLLLREPGGTAISESIREVLLATKHREMTQETELLLFAAARAQIVREKIAPALAEGTWVICDRFMDSTTAYQGYGRDLAPEFIRKLNAFAVGECVPDLTIYVDIDIETAQARLRERAGKSDRLDQAGEAFMRRVRDGYLAIAREDKERIAVIDGTKSVPEVTEDILSVLRRT